MDFNLLKHQLIQKYPALGKFLRVQYGLILEELKETDYLMGGDSIIKKKLIESGDWSPYLPSPERQSGRYVETMSCTVFGFFNALETLAKFHYEKDWDKSDRFTAKLAGIGPDGGVMSSVLESVRKEDGAVDQAAWSNNIDGFSWGQFFAAVPDSLKEQAKQFLNDYELKYEAVSPGGSFIREALKYSPIYCAGYAWYRSGERYYSAGRANHCFMIYGMTPEGHYLAYDSYEPFKKTLDKSFAVTYPKLLVLRKRAITEFNEDILRKLISRGIKYIMRTLGNGEIYRIEDNLRLTYLSPEEWNDINVMAANKRNELIGVNEEFFNQIIS